MSLLGRLGVLVALALSMFLGTGCGGTVLDATKIEEQLQANIENTQKRKVASIDCPSGVDVEPKTKFSCAVHLADGSEETATILIRDKEANTTLLSLQPAK
jgi:NAD(P)H-hydrate repair Nnr-like enzyme with NAD(P)H-hydrate epimerase domain